MQTHTYQALLDTSRRVNWRIEDIIGGDKRLDFTKPFLPETFVRSAPLTFLSPREKLLLNHIRAHGYLSMFGLVEEFILPFIEGQAEGPSDRAPFRSPALEQFAVEEAKHIELFRRFCAEFRSGFATPCAFIGPASEIRDVVLGHSPIGVAVCILGIEWMSQRHYVESIHDNAEIDPQFRSLLRNHWIEEAQHAKLDAMVLEELVAKASPAEIEAGFNDYFAIGGVFDAGLKQQAAFDLEALEAACGRTFAAGEREQFLAVQFQALRWTFLGSAMTTTGFLDAIGKCHAPGRAQIESVAPAFC